MQSNPRANELRKNLTDAERKIWRRLRSRQLCGYKFRRQVPIGHYIVDFVCMSSRLIVELDGGQHAEDEAKDNQRTEYLENRGFVVLRFWNTEALNETESVLGAILEVLEAGRD